MTTWVGGDVITSAWMNEIEKILALGTFGLVTEPRLTMAPNITFDLAGNVVASNLIFNGSVASSGTQQWEGISFRSVASTHSGTGFNALIQMDHTTNSLAAGASCYGIIGGVTGTAGSGKINPAYFRVTASNTFAGTADGVQIGATYNTGATVAAGSALLALERSGSNTNAFPYGVVAYSNTAGRKIANMFAILDSLDITASCFQWNMRTGSVGSFLLQYDDASAKLFEVDYLGNLNFKANGDLLAAGQLITGDMSNGVPAQRLAFQTAEVDTGTTLDVIPNGSAVLAGIALWADSDRLGTERASMTVSPSAAYYDTIDLPLRLATNGASGILLTDNGSGNPPDVFLGTSGAQQTDTTGYHFMQSISGAPSDVPSGAVAGHVAFRYDDTNNKIYVYNGGWKSTAALT